MGPNWTKYIRTTYRIRTSLVFYSVLPLPAVPASMTPTLCPTNLVSFFSTSAAMKSAQSSRVVPYLLKLLRTLTNGPRYGILCRYEFWKPVGTSAEAINELPRGTSRKLIVLLAGTIWLGQNIDHWRYSGLELDRWL